MSQVGRLVIEFFQRGECQSWMKLNHSWSSTVICCYWLVNNWLMTLVGESCHWLAFESYYWILTVDAKTLAKSSHYHWGTAVCRLEVVIGWKPLMVVVGWLKFVVAWKFTVDWLLFGSYCSLLLGGCHWW